MHFSVGEGIVTAAVAVMLFFLSMPAEKRIDEMSLRSYKRLLQKLVADRVATYFLTYNDLLKVFTDSKQKIAEFEKELQSSILKIPLPAAGEKASLTLLR